MATESDDVRQAKVEQTDGEDLEILGIQNPDVGVVVDVQTGEVRRTEGSGVRIVGIKNLEGGYVLHVGDCDW